MTTLAGGMITAAVSGRCWFLRGGWLPFKGLVGRTSCTWTGERGASRISYAGLADVRDWGGVATEPGSGKKMLLFRLQPFIMCVFLRLFHVELWLAMELRR